MALIATPPAWITNWRALRSAQRRHRPTIVSRGGRPSLLVLPINNASKGRSASSPQVLAAIDRAEEQIANNTMTPLDDALVELGVDDKTAADAAIEIDAAVEQVLAAWLGRDFRMSLPFELGHTRLAQADVSEAEGAVFELKTYGSSFREDDPGKPDISLSLRQLAGDRTTIYAYVLHPGDDAYIVEYTNAVQRSLGELKRHLEESSAPPAT